MARAVVVSDLQKTFRVPTEQVSTLKERALHPLRRRTTNDLRAVDDVSFEVQQGEFFGIVGRNGSGKSTLLKCLAGIYRQDAGEIRIGGRLSTFIELGVGFNPDLAARDNVRINAIMLGLSPAEANRRFEEIIAFAELEDFTELKLKNYSSGMLVRLAFSTAIQVDADVLLIDEVLAVGDAGFQQKCFEVFQQMKDEGRTILFVTHDMGAVKRFCDRAMLLEHGQVRIVDEPERVGNHYMEMNFGRESVRRDEHRDEDRYGDQGATIEDAWFEDERGRRTSHLPQGSRAAFAMRLAFHQDFPDPVPSVLIENEQHTPLMAISTYDARVSTGWHQAGDQAIARVSFDCLFAPGRITATPWVMYPSGAEVADRRPRFASCVVSSTRHSGAVVDLPAVVRYDRVPAPVVEVPVP